MCSILNHAINENTPPSKTQGEKKIGIKKKDTGTKKYCKKKPENRKTYANDSLRLRVIGGLGGRLPDDEEPERDELERVRSIIGLFRFIRLTR